MSNNILIIGKAKTGTTVISKTIQHSIPNSDYFLEPKEICFFESSKLLADSNPKIVKIIFEHWNVMPRLRNAIIYNETKLKFDKIVCINRDLRDEIISRLFYIIFPYTIKHGFKRDLVDQWLKIIIQKEQSPSSISIISMIKEFNKLFVNGYQLSYVVNLANLYFNFLNNHQARFFIIKYEDFIDSSVDAFETYLEFKLSKNNSVEDLERTNRSASHSNWKRYFTKEDIDYFEILIGGILGKQGYTDWELQNPKALNPDHGSKYIRKILSNITTDTHLTEEISKI